MRSRFSCLTLPLLALLAAAPGLAGAYQPPQAHDDGWAVADAAAQGWQVERFGELEAAIAKGTFADVTSIVVAKDGKLVYEPTSTRAAPTSSTTCARRPRASPRSWSARPSTAA
ncbi:hypothetical protein [Lysobacter capsici]|uniref:hypothetical protein n=1 Tax=Lysobacter capsici TaxID=435897 RepID=UPI00398CD32C